MRKAGVRLHRLVRATGSLVRAFRTSGPGHRTADRALTPTGRTAWHRPNPWPRCVACHRHVAALCPEGCGVCPSCCSGEH